MNQLLSLNDVIEVKTERLAYGGEAVARYQGITVFVRGAAPGEEVRVRITASKKRYARARIEEVLIPSPFRRDPKCQYFGICGGCQLQHLSYPAQLEAKVDFIRDAIKRIGGIKYSDPIEIRSAAEYGYRSRARIQVECRHDKLAIGFHKAASDSVCDVESCPILQPILNDALARIRTHLRDEAGSTKFSRSELHIASGDSDVAVSPAMEQVETAANHHVAAFSHDVLRTVHDFRLRFPPTSFFQGNDLLLNDFIEAAVGGESGEIAVDLYAGVGLFTLPLARRFQLVLAVESNSVASHYARLNIEANNVQNASIIHGRVETWLKDLDEKRSPIRPDFVLLDPPRNGAADAIELIAKMTPRRITYVSCDPNTMARDLMAITRHGYQLTRVLAFDFFPQTFHVESIITVERSDT